MFDYRDERVVEKIKEASPDLEYIFDTIGNETSSVTASQAISERGGVLCTVRPNKAHTENVSKQTKVTTVLVWTAFLKEHQYGSFYWPVSNNTPRSLYFTRTRLTQGMDRLTRRTMSCARSFSRNYRLG